MATESTELERVKTMTPKELEIAYAAILDGAPLPFDRDPEIVSRAIAARIMEADSFEAAFVPQEIDGWAKVLLDVPVLVKDFHLNPSTIEGDESSSSVYAVVDVESMIDGETHTVTCGGKNVLMQLVKMFEKGWTNRPVKLIGKKTREGYTALWLESAETS